MTAPQIHLPGIQPTAWGGELDFWETPRSAAEALIPKLPKRGPWRILDACAGRGAIIDVLASEVPSVALAAVELHPGRFEELRDRMAVRPGPRVACYQCDFFDVQVPEYLSTLDVPGDAPLLIAMNSPYSKPRETIGLEFVELAITLAEPDGCVAALLPVDFATGVARYERVHKHHRSSVYPFVRRQDFGGETTGQRPTAWFVWDLLEPKSVWEPLT